MVILWLLLLFNGHLTVVSWSCYGLFVVMLRLFHDHVTVVGEKRLMPADGQQLTADFWRRWAAAAPRGTPLLKVRLSHMMKLCRRDSWENDRRRFAAPVE